MSVLDLVQNIQAIKSQNNDKYY